MFCLSCTTAPLNPDTTPQGFLFKNIYIELFAVAGAEPTSDALDYFQEALDRNHFVESRNIQIIKKSVADPYPSLAWTRDKITLIENKLRKYPDKTPTNPYLRLFILYMPGRYVSHPSPNLAGLQYSNSAFLIIRDGCGKDIEGSCLLHEFAHAIGVASGRANPVKPDRPHHCNNEACVMFWQITGPHKDFDEDCLQDIRALINKRS